MAVFCFIESILPLPSDCYKWKNGRKMPFFAAFCHLPQGMGFIPKIKTEKIPH